MKTNKTSDEILKSALTLQDLDLKHVAIKEDEIKRYISEDQFTVLSIELLKEAAIIGTVIACTFRLDGKNQPRKWARNEAVLGGLAIRISKLLHGILDQTCQDRREIAEIIFRCLAETAINLTYLTENYSDKNIEEYIEYSLREEKRFLNKIEGNIVSRGIELPIETRMKKSILSAFEDSGISPENVNEEKTKAWGKSIYRRAERIGMKEAYQGLISMTSHAVHGNWQDLITHHLKIDSDGFLPETNWTKSRPQYLLVSAILCLKALETYCERFFPACEDKDKIIRHMNDCRNRVIKVDQLHESFLAIHQT